jgi:PAS domain S-box-containing protein
MKKQFFRRYPFSYYLIGAIFLILMIAVAGLIGISSHATEHSLRENARAVELQTEDNLAAVFRAKEEGFRIFDKSLDYRMEAAFPQFLAEYERTGGDPSKMDLESVKEATGGMMELYVIDSQATVVATTYTPELGLRFGDFAPYFATYLDKIRSSEGFHPDHIVSEKSTGAMKKFAYFPTPDHRYILELGLPVNTTEFSAFRTLDRELVLMMEEENPYFDGERVFDTTLREHINGTPVEVTDPALRELLAGVLANRSTLEVKGPDPGITTRYLFIDLGNDAFGSDVSRIIELRYTDAPIRQALTKSTIFYLSLAAFAILGCAVLAILSIGMLTRPIGKMADDIDIIAGGDLDHPLTPPVGSELIRLEESISEMVGRLKAIIAELRTSEENYRTLVESANSAILRIDTRGNIRFINPYAETFFGYSRNDIIGRNVVGTIVPSQDSTGTDLESRIKDIVAHPEVYEGYENENIRKDGSRIWMSWTNRPLHNRDGEVVEILTIGNDITRIKQAEREVQQLNTELEERVADRTRQLVEAIQNLESFTYSVSHDLRAPLRAISGYSSILLGDLADLPEKDRKYLELVRQNAHEMGQLIDDLLNFSRLGQHSLRKETVLPATLVKDVIGAMQSDPSVRKVEFRTGNLPPCHADPAMLKMALANLISNAVKFSRGREFPVVEIGSVDKGGEIVYFVRDNGIGFDMRYAERIFGVFQRLHPAEEYEGTGVGLAIVRRVIDLHGGRIWVESEPGKGTTFFFTTGDTGGK